MINLVQISSDLKEIPLKDFFKNPEKTGYKISPDGNYISFLAPFENRLNIFVQETGTENIKRITSVTKRDIAGHIWGNNNRLIYLNDNKGDENFHLYAIDKDGANLKELTPFDGVRVSIVDELEDIENEILIEMNKRDSQVFDAFRLNVVTGEMKSAAENPGNISRWITDHEGQIRAASTSDGVNTSLLYRESEDVPFRTILTTSFKETLSPLFFTFDNKNIYAASNIGRDKTAIVKFAFDSVKETEVLFEHPEVDVYDLHYSKKRKVLTYITFTAWKQERHVLDEEIGKVFKTVDKELAGYEAIISDMNKNEDKILIRSYSDRSFGAFYLYDVNTNSLSKLSDINPWMDEKEMAAIKPIKYTSRDGLEINGYLTLPKGVEPKNLPVVVNPHGGPWARDNWTYNPEVQFFANRGYAVLQMNFRGSTGYGKKFLELSYKQWGRSMQDDITDGVKWLIDQGMADPKRIAIYGGSYGGYATLAGLAFTPELYACGVDYVGVSNLFTFMKSIPEYWKPMLEMMYEMVGNPEKDKELLKEASPVFHVDKIKAPLFVVQGRMDPRVNINESDQMVSALKERGVEVPYMVKDNEGHGFANQENKFDFYEAMEKFLADHLKP
jgi:dipeptidyl aminopeptidase/acylaminoacyl peptidase